MDLSDLNLPATGLLRQQSDAKPVLSPQSDSTIRATTYDGEKSEKQGIGTNGPGGWKIGSAIRSCFPGAQSAKERPASEFEDEKPHFADFSKPRTSTASHPVLDRLGDVFLPRSLRPRSKMSTRSSRSSRSSITSISSSIRPRPSARYNLLLRIAACRRLVTSLTRILTPKNEVVAQIRKRLMSGGSLVGNGSGIGSGMLMSSGASAVDLDIYWGDVQGTALGPVFAEPYTLTLTSNPSDHIMTMHHSLVHYERILSHSHPAYLSHLRWSLSNGKGGIDRAILTLTSVTITCFTIQLCLSKYRAPY